MDPLFCWKPFLIKHHQLTLLLAEKKGTRKKKPMKNPFDHGFRWWSVEKQFFWRWHKAFIHSNGGLNFWLKRRETEEQLRSRVNLFASLVIKVNERQNLIFLFQKYPSNISHWAERGIMRRVRIVYSRDNNYEKVSRNKSKEMKEKAFYSFFNT